MYVKNVSNKSITYIFIIDDYIDYYNNDRCQWDLKRLTPIPYRNQLAI